MGCVTLCVDYLPVCPNKVYSIPYWDTHYEMESTKYGWFSVQNEAAYEAAYGYSFFVRE